MRRLVVVLAACLALTNCRGAADDAARAIDDTVRAIMEADSSINSLDDALRAARVHADDFGFPRTGSLEERSIISTIRSSGGVSVVDDPFKIKLEEALRRVGAFRESQSFSISKDVACDVFDYFMDSGGKIPTADQLADYIGEAYIGAQLAHPFDIAVAVLDFFNSTLSQQSTNAFLTLFTAGCALI